MLNLTTLLMMEMEELADFLYLYFYIKRNTCLIHVFIYQNTLITIKVSIVKLLHITEKNDWNQWRKLLKANLKLQRVENIFNLYKEMSRKILDLTRSRY